MKYTVKEGLPVEQQLRKSGFYRQGNTFVKRYDLKNDDFYAVVFLSDNTFTVTVFDRALDEEYTLFNVENATGTVVGSLREEVDEILCSVTQTCFALEGLRKEVLAYAQEKYASLPDRPFAEDDISVVLRNPKGKWYALFMRIPLAKLQKDGKGEVDVLNVKLSPQTIRRVVDGERVFPAYHMNKKLWATVVLNGMLSLSDVCLLLDESYSLVTAKSGK